ncbi:MAG TPA: SMP-30/gluconolactonase/LRE family protein [Planctomycetaceae bacterium]|jgi:sugar lactone lactonase YvrE/enterochelin esterase-like enzyme|nr:SMP-30/gluconolactonase/LRE family protein [Planctomycetaceae bacterium]
MLRVFALAGLWLASLGSASAFADEPQTSGPPRGEVQKYSFDHSRIFPGTVRDYWVYVPKQYDPAKPACVYVGQDGVGFGAPAVFDELIEWKAMPVTIGVFIMHGRVKALSKNAIDRFNRSFEYDGLGDNYVRFLLEEILPEVEKKTAADGRPIRLSHDGNDRCIGGISSGAICAFTAAWERPDAFSRVFSSVGTFVGLRGGNNYPTWIRKYEPKPIRIFLEDGTNDQNIAGGDWWMANQEMERALRFAGYEVNHAWGEGGHNDRHAREVFPEAMRWLWKDWPKPVKAGAGSPQLQDILIPDEPWKLVADGYKFTEGPAANAKGEVFFNDIPNSKTYKIDLDGKVTLFLADSKQGNGQAFGPDGQLYAVASATNQILAYDTSWALAAPAGAAKPTTIADGFNGNDLVVLQNGGIYVTNPAQPNPAAPGKVWYISPKGEKKVVDTGLKLPNGIAVSPDQSLLYVAECRSHWVWSYQIQPDGSLAAKQRYFHLHMLDRADNSGVDGIRVDRDGRLYSATDMGIQISDPAGRVFAIIPTPNGEIANLCFGGPQFDTIYATCRDRVYKRRVKTRGANAFAAPIKPAPPRL